MEERRLIWILVLDTGGGRLLSAIPTSGAGRERLRLEEVETFPNPLEELERGSGAGKRHAELLGRYAADVTQWLDRSVKKRGIDEFEVFAPTRLFSLLRSMVSPPLAQRMRVHTTDLSGLGPAELQRHPAIQKLTEEESDARQAS